jgi:hypothetical protein
MFIRRKQGAGGPSLRVVQGAGGPPIEAILIFRVAAPSRFSKGRRDWFISFQMTEEKEDAFMAWFYEIRSSDNAVLKRDGGFATQDAAKIAGREDAKKMKNSRQPDRLDVGRIMVGQNAEKATRY